jgi:hypothetical protein
MGHEVVYCDGCQNRIHGSEIEKGKAFAFGSGVCCRACAPKLLQTLAPADRQRLQEAMKRPPGEARHDQSSSSTGLRRLPDLTSSSTAVRRVRVSSSRIPIVDTPGPGTRRLAPAPSRSPALAVGLASGAVAALLLAAVLVSSRSPAPAPPTSSTPRAAPAVAPDVPAPLREARDYEQRRPEDVDGQIQRWEKAAWALEGSPSLEEAKGRLAAARARRKDAADRALALLETELKPLLDQEAFGLALDLLERSQRRFAHPDWTLPVERRIDQVRADVAGRFALLREDILSARERRADAELRAAADRVARWALPSYGERLKELLATPAAAPPPSDVTKLPGSFVTPPPPKADLYRPVWEKAAALAGLRDYAGAAKELEAARALDPQAAADLDLFKRAAAVPAEARDALGRWAKGQKQAVDVLDPAGRPVHLEAPYLRLEEGRLLFGAGADIQIVEIGELAPSTLAALFLARPKKVDGDERVAAAFCLLEGDVEGAGRFKAELPLRYADWGRAALAARAGGREAEARALFAAAEDGAEDPSRAAQAVAQYKDLLARLADTAFVARNRASITARAGGAREFLFGPDDLTGAGAFRPAKGPKGESAWISEKDGDPAQLGASYVEAAYSALPGVEYRGWIYAGGCCLETFDCGVQGTGLRAAEPGDPGVMPVKIPFFLRKTHASHGGPKAPSRWDWVPLPMPPAGDGGPRTLRVASVQQGFAVAYVVISATPDFVPRILEVKERERARAARRPPVPPEAGLVGYWSFDDGQGGVAADASPRRHAGRVVGAAWTQGRFGGGLRFDGIDSHVELPSTPALDDLQKGDYTLAAWFKPEGVPTGQGAQNDTAYGLILKRGRHLGLTYLANHVSAQHWYGDENVGAGVGGSWPLGTFRHVGATYSRRTGQLQVYLDGRLAGAGAGKPGQAVMEYGTERWRIGIGGPGATEYRWAARGVIDEVRLYDRALSPVEMRALAEGRPAPAPRPAPDARPWTALALEKFVGPGFRMENGVLAKIPTIDAATRSPTDHADVEFRIRFEFGAPGYTFFAVRQGGGGSYVAQWPKSVVERMPPGERELVFVCKGDAVAATLDGQPQPIERWGDGVVKAGALQFNTTLGAELRIKSIEVRDAR